MACVNEKGQLNQTVVTILQAITNESLTIDEIAKKTSLPLFKVRSNLREMQEADYLIEHDGAFSVNPNAAIPFNK